MADSTDIRTQLLASAGTPLEVTAELAEDRDALRAAIAAAEAPAVVAAFGVLERLPQYVAVVETLAATAAEAGATVVLDVPNHGTTETAPADGPVFTPGAVEELRRLLPPDHVVLHEVPLRGSAVVPAGAETATRTVEVEVGAGVPSRILLAFGPGAASLRPVAAVAQVDATGELARVRALEADAALVTALLDERRA